MLKMLSIAVLAALCVPCEFSSLSRCRVVLRVWGGEYVCSPETIVCSSPGVGISPLVEVVCCFAKLFPLLWSHDESSPERVCDLPTIGHAEGAIPHRM